MFQVLCQQLRGTLTTAFERHVTVLQIYSPGSTYVLILSWVNIMKRKSTKFPGKLSVAQKSKPALDRTLHQKYKIIFHLLLYTSFSLKQTYMFLN